MDFYYKINQLDRRIENYHLSVIDPIIYKNLLNDLEGQIKSIEVITEYEFLLGSPPDIKKVALHDDLNKPGDAKGECLGYIEHYEVAKTDAKRS